ncbi:hypothetical protein PENNAL_c0001G04375 [Penicillium nalgiovense]|uniref:Uncharacterized protein n=1 Tax=Penicillium nalgiovense TaxID=60175 RepID=A0A1V6ZAU0_PENNA|nr:hypothetical protein PENNAL_c0001G04375 [Penicillium nalgiovense]
MLRRKPTAIAITSEDIAAFEEARLRKLSEENKHPEQHVTRLGLSGPVKKELALVDVVNCPHHDLEPLHHHFMLL